MLSGLSSDSQEHQHWRPMQEIVTIAATEVERNRITDFRIEDHRKVLSFWEGSFNWGEPMDGPHRLFGIKSDS